MQKTKDMALLSFVLNFFHGVLIGKREKVLLTPTVGKLPYLCYIYRVCACVRTCVFVCVFFSCVFVCLCLCFCDDQESVCVAPLLILRGLKCLTPVTRFPLRPPSICLHLLLPYLSSTWVFLHFMVSDLCSLLCLRFVFSV